MADVNRGNRPLSPHMTIYRPQMTSMLSIAHRITGIAQALGAVLVVWWLLAAATNPGYFHKIDDLWMSWLGHLVWLGLTLAFSYHLLNGIRHLVWDTGRGLDLPSVYLGGKAVLVGTVVLTVLIWIFA